ncbi:MAG: hypothetical protein WC497_01515 [Patescibacteria group bacterium]
MAIRVATVKAVDFQEGMTAEQVLAAAGVEFDLETQRLVSAKDGEIKPDAIIQDGDIVNVEPISKGPAETVIDETDAGKKPGAETVIDETDAGKKPGAETVVGEAGAGGGGGEAVQAAAGGAGAAKE